VCDEGDILRIETKIAHRAPERRDDPERHPLAPALCVVGNFNCPISRLCLAGRSPPHP
jgi:hypothetical protein